MAHNRLLSCHQPRGLGTLFLTDMDLLHDMEKSLDLFGPQLPHLEPEKNNAFLSLTSSLKFTDKDL